MFNLKKNFFKIWMKKVLETVWVSTPYMLKEEKYYIYIVYIVYTVYIVYIIYSIKNKISQILSKYYLNTY